MENYIKIDENNLPEIGIELLCFNKKWIDKDFNPNSVRIGFRTDEGFTTAYWFDHQDTYININKSMVTLDFTLSKKIKNNTEPTHYMLIPKMLNNVK